MFELLDRFSFAGPAARDRTACLLLVALAMFANVLPLLGIVKADTQLLYSGLQRDVVPGFLSGLPYIDPSAGFIYEPEAREALRQWLTGSLPWWNHYEGVGVPLAGALVPGAFSPFLVLLLLPNGLVLQQIVAQIACGLLTYVLLRMLRCDPLAAAAGAGLFELNGTFAWLGSLWCHPLPALPLSLVGLELLRRGSRRDLILAGVCLAFATYLAIVASFIEIGYLDGLLAVGWFAVRTSELKGAGALRYAGRAAAAALVGIMLAAPQLASFADALKYGTSAHAAGSIGYNHLVGAAIPQAILPYLYGPIFGYSAPEVGLAWGNVGGYIGVAPVLVAAAVIGFRRERRLAYLLVGWIVLTVGAQFGLQPLLELFNLIPGVSFTAQYRYSAASWEFATAMLCALALSEWRSNPHLFLGPPYRYFVAALGVALLVSVAQHGGLVGQLGQYAGYSDWLIFTAVVAALAAAATLMVAARPGLGAHRALAVVLLAEALLYYFVPTLSYPRGGRVDDRVLAFLRSHLGYSRIFSMNGFAPNYGTYYRIPMINYNDPLLPANWTQYVDSSLDPLANPLLFLQYRTDPSPERPGMEDTFAWHRRNFEAVAVKYVTGAPANLLAAFAPPVAGSQIAFPLGPAVLEGQLTGLARQRLDSIDVLVGTYRGDADGFLIARVCSRRRCAGGRVSLADVADNSYAHLQLDKPVNVAGGKLSFTLAQQGYTKALAVWLFGRGDANERIVKGPADHFPQLRFTTDSPTYETPTKASDNVPFPLAGRTLHVDLPAPQSATAVGAVAVLQGNYRGRANGGLQVRVCSGADCAGGVAKIAGSTDDGFLEVRLRHRVRVTTPRISIDFDQIRSSYSDAIWLFPQIAGYPEDVETLGKTLGAVAPKLRLSAEYDPPVEAYRDELGSLFELPGAQPYAQAAGCAVQLRSRDDVDLDCARPSRLVRRELFYPGWSAAVNGTPGQVDPALDLFEQVAVPQGRSTVRFHYEPAHARLAFAFWALALALLIAGCGTAGAMAVRERAKPVAALTA